MTPLKKQTPLNSVLLPNALKREQMSKLLLFANTFLHQKNNMLQANVFHHIYFE